MVEEVVERLAVRADGVYVDTTLGSGGHAEAILRKLGETGKLIGMDRDRAAVERCMERLKPWRRICTLVHEHFVNMPEILNRLGIREVDGIVIDLGVSSEQLEEGERGFSFMHDGPLDMRMDVSRGRTAADVVNDATEDELVMLLRRFGEERQARCVARAIVAAREQQRITTTARLAGVVTPAKGGRRGRIHPATKTFQALRIEMNEELKGLNTSLENALCALIPGGRLAVLSYHSLEDRCVKECFKRHVGRRESLAAGGDRWVGDEPPARWITHTFVKPDEMEIKKNPRSRSAKLRVMERIDYGYTK